MLKDTLNVAFQAEVEQQINFGREEPTKLLKKLLDGLLNKNGKRFNQRRDTCHFSWTSLNHKKLQISETTLEEQRETHFLTRS